MIYLAKLKHRKVDAITRVEKTTTEAFAVAAKSPSDAEDVLRTYADTYTTGKYRVVSIKEKPLDFVPESTGEWLFEVVATYVDVDEESGKEQKVSKITLLRADDIPNALDQHTHFYRELTAKYEVPSVGKSEIVEYLESALVEGEKILVKWK